MLQSTFLTLIFFSSDLTLSTIQELHTHTLHGVHVIYLEPIVNSSLWLNENVDKTLQSYANTGRSVKGEIHMSFSKYQHNTPGCWDSSKGTVSGVGAMGGQDAIIWMAHVIPLRGHAAECRSLSVLHSTSYLNRSVFFQALSFLYEYLVASALYHSITWCFIQLDT